MSIDFKSLITMLSLTTPRAVVLSVCIDVGVCLCPISPIVILSGTASRQLINSAHSSASAADDMAVLMILEIVVTAPLFGGSEDSSVTNKCPSALLRDLASERYDVSMWLLLLWLLLVLSVELLLVVVSGLL